jgi:tetratricopeptide (TPR) repeat protein
MTLQAPKNARRSYENAQQAFAKTELDKAERELKKATNVYPRFALAWTLLGRVHDKEARLDEAKEDYLRALSADSRLIRPYRRLAEIAFESKNWQEVVQLTNQLITIHPSDAPVAYLYNAAANFNMGNLDAAELNGRRFEWLDSKHMWPQAYLLLGDILKHKGKYREAAQQMKMFLAIVPQDPFAEAIAKEADRLQGLGDRTDGRNSETH